jgi:hypothetical protein
MEDDSCEDSPLAPFSAGFSTFPQSALATIYALQKFLSEIPKVEPIDCHSPFGAGV